jgi:UDP-glucose 4-epimerase
MRRIPPKLVTIVQFLDSLHGWNIMSKHILVTGGAGYIGSHTVVELLLAGYRVTVLDNLSNSSEEALRRVETIAGRQAFFVKGDVRDAGLLKQVLGAQHFDACIHFAGLKAVGESVAKPLEYYDNNVAGTNTLLKALSDVGVKKFIFSSSATVYGDPEFVPLTESARTGATNPYGRSKWMVEFVLNDLAGADKAWAIGILRYFNPVGAHSSGMIGEDPAGIPNNLMPFVAQVAVGKLKELAVFGDDYATKDGTGVRDYIHVVDLAKGHLAALNRVFEHDGAFTVNLGTGNGYSVKDMILAFEKSSGRAVPFKVVARRPGDIAECYADPSYAANLLGWKAEKGIEDMCADGWRWQSMNPQGY